MSSFRASPTDVLCEFLSILVQSMLHAAHVYPEQCFAPRIAYDITVWMASAEALQRYIHDHIWWIRQKPASVQIEELVVSIQDLHESDTRESEPREANNAHAADAVTETTSNRWTSVQEHTRLRVRLPDSGALERVQGDLSAPKLYEAYKARFRLLLCRVQTYAWPPAPCQDSNRTWNRTFRLYYRAKMAAADDTHHFIFEDWDAALSSDARTAFMEPPCSTERSEDIAKETTVVPRSPASVFVPLCDDCTGTAEWSGDQFQKLALFAFVEELPIRTD